MDNYDIRPDTPVSVVVPLYNHARFIAAAIHSIQSQDHPIADIIIIDDGSTDDSFAAASAASVGDERISVLQQDNSGAATTLNRAIALCRGAVIAILNSDDQFHEARLRTLVGRMAADRVDFIFSRIAIIDGNGQLLDHSWFDDASEFWRISGRLDLALIRNNFIGTTSNIVVRKHVSDHIGGFAAFPYCHDLDFFLRAIRKDVAIGFVDEQLLFYRKHDTNTISTAPKSAVAVEHAAVVANHVAHQLRSGVVNVEGLRDVRRTVEVLRTCLLEDGALTTRFTVALAAALTTTEPTTEPLITTLQAADRKTAATPMSLPLARYPYEVITIWKTGLQVSEDAVFLHPGVIGIASQVVFRVESGRGPYLFNTRLTVSDPRSQPVCFTMLIIESGIMLAESAITIDGGQSLVVNLPFETHGETVDLVLRTQMSAAATNNYFAHARFVRPLIRPHYQLITDELPPKIVPPRRVFVVLGMHRAGTSLCMQILNRCGISVGAPLMPATATNPDGHWEHLDIQRQHDALLDLLGKTWSSPGFAPEIPHDWWERPEVLKISNTLRELVAYELATSSGVWGFKDPRTVRFLPLWMRIFAELEIEPTWILAVRNPVAVAMSLHKRDGIPYEVGEILWLEHYLDAIRYLGGRIAAIVRYEHWFSAPLRQGYNLARLAGRDDIDGLIDLTQILRTGVKPWLYHQRPSTDHVPSLALTATVNGWFDREPATLDGLVEIAAAIMQGTTLGMHIAAHRPEPLIRNT